MNEFAACDNGFMNLIEMQRVFSIHLECFGHSVSPWETTVKMWCFEWVRISLEFPSRHRNQWEVWQALHCLGQYQLWDRNAIYLYTIQTASFLYYTNYFILCHFAEIEPICFEDDQDVQRSPFNPICLRSVKNSNA